MDSDHSSMEEVDSQSRFNEYLNHVLSDFPPRYVSILEAAPMFRAALLDDLGWYDQETHNLHLSEGLSNVHPQLVLSAVTRGREALCRILCCIFLESPRFSFVAVYPPRLMRVNGKLEFVMEMVAEKPNPFVDRPDTTEAYRELIYILDPILKCWTIRIPIETF
ncbi:hypothetical protein KC19_7G086500 [Ceratodon purpureus]|uniref:Uncharacterized protein n=1 Tax=Ceratodon purpureus TaxID=3225 RepID=A0A8T0H8U5_CERPU|nr:hypothetical protein KC19_7G086500 [Ceratodon purpureus]